MDRYSRGYHERYRNYYKRPSLEVCRSAEDYRTERDYKDSVSHSPSHSPSSQYSSRSPGRDNYSIDHRHSYPDTKVYSSRYSPDSSPSRSPSRSPQRSFGYYSSSYNARRSSSPRGMSSRSESIDKEGIYKNRYFQSSSLYAYSSHKRPLYPSRRHYSGPPSSHLSSGNRPGYPNQEPKQRPVNESSSNTMYLTSPTAPKGILTPNLSVNATPFPPSSVKFQPSHSYPKYHSFHNSYTPQIKPNISWLEKYFVEYGKLLEEEAKTLAAVRKSRFELDLINWDVSKLEHQLELVQKQWQDNGMETLIRNELAAKLSSRRRISS
ncbi:hypothetical protein G6F56_003517 [Rhizopus delemar]|uniref:Uncharacterized protein n=1 Tax=Rhizopus stolonifer TaxID=4846 RepID=A0A367KK47_RHIST|nr:hypothetical protein G6F56_003517 [Rhizopus delemar]RCI02605.1 hypothetical protein CU098_010466 [Rhizopus stolonifer]